MTVWLDPTGTALVAQVAEPADTATGPPHSAVDPTVNVTVPSVSPDPPPVTVAVYDPLAPYASGEEGAVKVTTAGDASTVTVVVLELELKFVSPL